MNSAISKSRKAAVVLPILLAVSLSSAFAGGQQLKDKWQDDAWWAERAALLSPRFQLTLMSTSDLGARALDTANPNAPDAIKTWDGGAATVQWEDGNNWNSDGVPGSGDSILLDNSSVGTLPSSMNTSGLTMTVKAITFDTANSVTLGNSGTGSGATSSITLNGLGDTGNTLISLTNNATGTFTIQPQNSGNRNLTLTLGASGTMDVTNAAGTLNITAAIGQTSSGKAIMKTGAGTLILGGGANNTYTGTTTISEGTLSLGKTSALNAFGGDLTLSAGTLNYSSTSDEQIIDSAKVTITGGTYAIGARTETVGQTSSGTSGLALSGTGAITIGSGRLNVANSANITRGTITFTAGGSLFANTELNFSGGTIDFATASAAVLNLRGGTGTGITYSSSGTTTAQVTSSGGGGSLSLNTASGATTVFNIADSTSVATEMIIVVPVTGAGKNIQKTGLGVLVLTGTNTYTGTTTVNAGKLLVNGNQSSATGAVAVNNSGTVLGGTGTIGGKVTVGSGAIILGGTGSSVGETLTVSNTSSGAITLQSGSIIELALGGSGTHSTLAHSGSGTISFASNQNFTFIDLGAQTTSYDNIITGTGLTSLDTSGWSITNSGWSGSFALDGSGNIDLILAAVPEPSTWIGGALALLALGYMQRRRFCKALVGQAPRLL